MVNFNNARATSDMHLSEDEDLEDYYSAADVLNRVRREQERLFSSQEVRRYLGLDEAHPPDKSGT